MKTPSIILLLAVTCVAFAMEARADDAYAEAKRRMQEGKALFDRGQYDDARMKYAQACALMHTFACVRGLGAMEYKSGHFVEACRHLSETLHDPMFAKLPESLQGEIQTMHQGAFDATGHVEVNAPNGVSVLLDGNFAGSMPLSEPIVVAPGRHTLEVRGPDGDRSLDVDVPAKVTTRVDLQPAPVAPPLPTALTPAAARPPPASVPVQAPSPTLADTPEPPSTGHAWWGPLRVWGLVAGGVGLGSLGLSAFFATQANGDGNRASGILTKLGPTGCSGAGAQSSNCQALSSAYSDESRDHALNLAFVGVGAAALVGGAALLLWPQGSHAATARTSPLLIPLFSTQAAGLQLRGEL